MSFVLTRGELEFQYAQTLNGQAYKIFLAVTGSLTNVSTLAQWEAAELTASNGYAAITGTIGAGVFNAATNAVESPSITGQFTATGSGFSYDAMVIKIGTTRTRPYALRLLTAPVVLSSGQALSIALKLTTKP